MTKPHILYISYDGMTDPLGQSQVLPYLTENSKHGLRFSIISFEKKDRFKKNKSTINQICRNSNINWYPKLYTKNPPIISTLWDLLKMYLQTKKIYRKDKFELIHCRSYQSAEVGMYWNKKHTTPWVFDMRGFWADERVDGNIWKMSSSIYRNIYKHYKKKEINFLTHSSSIISLTQNGKNEIITWQNKNYLPENFRNKNLEINIIPCCVDTSLFNIESIVITESSDKRKELSIATNQFILGYVGSIGTWYMLPEMLDFFKELKKVKSESIFLFITNEPKEKILEIANQKNISENDLRITSCQHKEVPIYISIFDISIYFILPAYSKKASSPTKQGELMSMGIPIVCNANVGDADKIVSETKSGWVVNDFDEESYKDVIFKIVNEPLPDKNQIIKHGKSEFDLYRGAKKFRDVYDSILNNEKK